MKKPNTLIAIIIGIVVFFIIPAIADTYQHNYTQICTVYEVENDVVTFIDPCGYLWDYVTTEDFNKHDTAKLYFHDNLTDFNRKDDIIKKIKRVD